MAPTWHSPGTAAAPAGDQVYKVSPGDVVTIKHVLHTSGPVAAGFDVYRDFMEYRSGV